MAYKAVIGLEMHCELKSNSKVFSPSKNGYSDLSNSMVNEIDMAFPGILPVVNKKCVEDAIKMAMVLHCDIPKYMEFDRKNYYYPDLPKGYQITQFHHPVGINGYVDVEDNNKTFRVDILDIHLEEDSASMEHLSKTSILDYNRAGVPLLELVTAPCIHSAEDAVAFINHMINVYRYCNVSDADTKKGQIRCDVNVSIMDENSETFGTKVEVKNVNSLSNIYETINYEIKRQSELKDQGRYSEVEQETRRFDEESGTTIRVQGNTSGPTIFEVKVRGFNWSDDLLVGVTGSNFLNLSGTDLMAADVNEGFTVTAAYNYQSSGGLVVAPTTSKTGSLYIRKDGNDIAEFTLVAVFGSSQTDGGEIHT